MNLKIVVAASFVSLALAGPSFSEGNAQDGERIFRTCSGCHALAEGENGAGPSLHNIVGSPSASVEGFRYSDSMANANLIWDEATLAKFLTNPKDVVPRNRMGFRGFRDAQDTNDLLVYLTSLGEE